MSNTAEEIAEYAVTEGLPHEIEAIAGEINAHTAQRLTTVKEKIENLPKSESIQTVLKIIEEELI